MDEDVVSQYISFLKLLSMNLTPDTVQFFYNYVCFWLVSSLFQTQSADPFPLFSICSKFYDNPEPMVRIAVRTITLNCLKGTTPALKLTLIVNDKNIVKYMDQPSTLKYFKKLVYYVISLVVTMNSMVESKYLLAMESICSSFVRVGEMTNNIIDQLLFLQDVLNIQVPCVNDYLKDVLVKEFFIRYCYEVIQHETNMVERWREGG